MLIAKLLLICSYLYKIVNHIRHDEKLVERNDKFGARLATATIFIVTLFLYYFAGIFNLTAQC
jgi:uncharacterized sodium:solute symporter family permease YidK